MLKLINIKMTDDYIEADYIPESSSAQGYAKLVFSTGERISRLAEGFGRSYPAMALSALGRLSEKFKSHPENELPKEKIVMWY